MTGDGPLRQVCESDVFWDEVVAVEPDGNEEVFDLTVPGTQNFVANNIIVHNSIEQDADIVMLLHHEDTNAEIIVGKQRAGETGIVQVVFDRHRTWFRDHDPGEGFKFS